MTRIVLVRHAETVWNAEGRWQGQTDVALSDRGQGEVALVAARLRNERFDRVIASDLSRAFDTARGIAKDAEIERDPTLREMNLGAWCGLFHHEVAERFPDQLHALGRGDDMRIGDYGETVLELAARVSSTIDRIAAESPNAKVLVVTHGGVVRAVLLELLGVSGRSRPLVGSRNTAITRVEVEGRKRTLVSYNDARHLPTDASDDEERVLGIEGRERVVRLLGLANAEALASPGVDAETRVATRTKQLVSYALDP